MGILRDKFSADQSKTLQPGLVLRDGFLPILLSGIRQRNGQHTPLRSLPIRLQVQSVTCDFALEAGSDGFHDGRDWAAFREVLNINLGFLACRAVNDAEKKVATVFRDVR